MPRSFSRSRCRSKTAIFRVRMSTRFRERRGLLADLRDLPREHLAANRAVRAPPLRQELLLLGLEDTQILDDPLAMAHGPALLLPQATDRVLLVLRLEVDLLRLPGERVHPQQTLDGVEHRQALRR
jgi:hypothetical protein